MAGKKKDVAAFTANMMDLVKKMAAKSGDKDVLAQVALLEKQKDEVLGELKTIGPCFACKETESCKTKDHDFRKSRWFTCPHGDAFCPDCIVKESKAAREKRKAEKKDKPSKKDKK